MSTNTIASIITPTYNRSHLLGRAIRSVLGQTFKDWEMIVVDDGSTDDTEALVRSFMDSRIKYICHETNRGAPVARNTGIKAAIGEYVGFLDSDDEWLPKKLELQVAVLSQNPGRFSNLGVVLTGTLAMDDRNGQLIRASTPQYRGNVYDRPFKSSLRGSCSMLVRRDCFDQVGYFDESLPASQNWDICVRLASKYEFDIVPDQLVITHRNHGAHVRTTDNKARAYEMLLEKYDGGIPNRRRFRAGLKLFVGRHYLQQGDWTRAVGFLWGALILRPTPRLSWHFLRGLATSLRRRSSIPPSSV